MPQRDELQSNKGPERTLRKVANGVAVFLVLAVAFAIWSSKNEPFQWSTAESKNTIWEYERYLKQFPQGEHANVARTRALEGRSRNADVAVLGVPSYAEPGTAPIRDVLFGVSRPQTAGLLLEDLLTEFPDRVPTSVFIPVPLVAGMFQTVKTSKSRGVDTRKNKGDAGTRLYIDNATESATQVTIELGYGTVVPAASTFDVEPRTYTIVRLSEGDYTIRVHKRDKTSAARAAAVLLRVGETKHDPIVRFIYNIDGVNGYILRTQMYKR